MNKQVKVTFDRYPDQARTRLTQIRAMILELAEQASLGKIEESLKMG